jgi:preprotein translocase subunit SecE
MNRHGAVFIYFNLRYTNSMTSLGEYIRETRGELKHVTWPTRRQAAVFTFVVIVISLGLALYLGFFDYIFGLGLKFLINRYGM